MVEDEKPAEKPAEEEPKPEDAPASSDLIEKANLAALRMEEANKERAKLIDREEALQVKRTLGGHSDAGQEPPKPKEETPAEYTKRIMEGRLKDGEGTYIG